MSRIRNAWGAWLLSGALLLMTGALARADDAPAQPADQPILRIEAGTHTAMVLGLSLSRDGATLATASNDTTVRLWSMPKLELQRTIHLPTDAVSEGSAAAVDFSPDGKFLVTSGYTGAWGNENGPWCFYVIETATGEIRRTVCDLPQRVFQLGFSPDGKYLVATLKTALSKKEGAGLRIYNAADYSLYRSDMDYADTAISFDFDRTTGRLVTTSLDGKLRLY
ncbi:MAG TPA: hypothetical protein VHX19_00170, partial [Stellaceae bacterium]|nr:hypothetical protein [Stellaceae bacterium]